MLFAANFSTPAEVTEQKEVNLPEGYKNQNTPLTDLRRILQCSLSDTQDSLLALSPQLKLQIKDMFQKRPLYVMMEEQLGCNPLYDHKVPKDVFPLYQARLDSLFEAFNLQLKVCVSQLF